MKHKRWLTGLPLVVVTLLACGPDGASGGAPEEGSEESSETSETFVEEAFTAADPASSAILFQGFHWRSASYGGRWYDTLAEKAADLRDLGVTHVWFPPPSDAASDEGYLPRRLDVLDSKYGSEASLRRAIAALRGQGVAAVADIVVNHRVGTTNWGDITNPTWGCEAVVADDEWSGRCGGRDTGDGYGAARDLDHSKPVVQEGVKTWLTGRLKAVGFTGMRYDFAKGFDARYAKAYADAFQPDLCVGEIWTNLDLGNVDAHRQTLVSWVDATGGSCATFDFTTKGLLNDVLRSADYGRLRDGAGKPAGALGYWPQRQITFVDNHDTGPAESCGSGQNMWPVPCEKVLQGYAYVLTHPGIPSIYYPHVYDWDLRAPIKALVAARRSVGITAGSPVAIARAERGLYAAVVSGKGGELAMKLGPSDWSPGAGWSLVASGNEYAVWTKGAAGGGSPTTGGAGTSTGSASSGGTSSGGTSSGGTTSAGTSGGSTGTPSCDVAVTFVVDRADTVFGQEVYVVGSAPALGAWDPARGVKLTIQGKGNNVPWTGTVRLPAGASFEYKYVKYDGRTPVWERTLRTPSGNRELRTRSACRVQQVRLDGAFAR